MLAILLRSPCQLRLWSCAGASTTHLGCSHHCHHAKEDQASLTTHSHRCLATEILSSIWTWDCQLLAAKSEHSDNLIQRWVAPRSFCRACAHLTESILPFPFKESLECWNQRILHHYANLHPTAMLNHLCRANLTLCPSICLCFIELLRFGKKIAS